MIYSHTQLDSELNSGKLGFLYLIYGTENYIIENDLKKIVKVFGEAQSGINYLKFDDTNIDNLIPNIETPAFGYQKKLLIVRNSGLFKKKKSSDSEEKDKEKDKDKSSKKKETDKSKIIAEYLEENEKVINDSVVIVFVEEEVTKNSLFNYILKNGKVCEEKELSLSEINRVVSDLCNRSKVRIDYPNVVYFVQCVGNNMQNIISELGKLVRYVGIGGEITKKDIDDLTIKQIDSYIFDMTDAIGKRNMKKALEILNNMIYMRQQVQMILIILYGHFKDLYLTKICIRENRDIVSNLGLTPNKTFLVKRYREQASYFKEEELKKILFELIDLDVSIKNGSIDPEVGIQTILCTYC